MGRQLGDCFGEEFGNLASGLVLVERNLMVGQHVSLHGRRSVVPPTTPITPVQRRHLLTNIRT